MLRAILHLRFKQAFKFQPIVFCSLPILIFDMIDEIMGGNKHDSKPLKVLHILIVAALMILCIIRNIR